MHNHGKIKIENIFYLLAYAWDCVGKSDQSSFGVDNFDNLDNIYSRLLDLALHDIKREGFRFDYINESNTVKGVKGKIDISGSVKSGKILIGKTQCEFDEYSIDNLINQIIKSTIQLV